MQAILTRITLVVMLASTVLAGSADSTGLVDLDLIDQFGGRASSLAIEADLVYAGIGPRLVVLDASDPHDPQVIGEGPIWYDLLTIVDIEIAGQYAYLANEHHGLRVLDISNPTQPQQVGRYDSPCISQDLYVSGDVIYIAESCGGMSIVNISDPANPQLLGLFTEWGSYVYINSVVLMNETYVFVTVSGLYGSGYGIIDVSDPSQPVSLGLYLSENSAQATPGLSGNGYVEFPYLYATFDNVLQIMDITDPLNPVFISAIVPCVNFVKAGNLLYAATAQPAVTVYDLSDIANPLWVRTVYTDDWTLDVAVSGNMLSVADSYAGLKFYDLSDPTDPLEVSQLITPYGSHSWVEDVIGNYLYFGDDHFGLRIFDLNHPVFPVEIGSYEIPEVENRELMDMDFDGTRGCLATWHSGVRIVDISDPAQPTEMGFYQPPEGIWVRSVDCEGELAYVGMYNSLNYCEIRLVDISDPTTPVEIGSYIIDSYSAPKLNVIGHLVYAFYDWDFHVIDYTDPLQPVEIAYIDGQEFTGYMAIESGYAYLSSGYTDNGVAVVDISDPTDIRQVYFQETPNTVTSVFATDQFLVLTLDDGGILVWDRASGAPFREVARFDMYNSRSSFLADNLIYLYADTGIYVLRMETISANFLPIMTK